MEEHGFTMRELNNILVGVLVDMDMCDTSFEGAFTTL